jgi:hypothetical protein
VPLCVSLDTSYVFKRINNNLMLEHENRIIFLIDLFICHIETIGTDPISRNLNPRIHCVLSFDPKFNLSETGRNLKQVVI